MSPFSCVCCWSWRILTGTPFLEWWRKVFCKLLSYCGIYVYRYRERDTQIDVDLEHPMKTCTRSMKAIFRRTMRPEINIKQTVPISERQILYVFYHACSSYILYRYTKSCITDDIKIEGKVRRGTKGTGRREKNKERGWREYEEEQAQHIIYTCMKTVKKKLRLLPMYQ